MNSGTKRNEKKNSKYGLNGNGGSLLADQRKTCKMDWSTQKPPVRFTD